MNQHHLNPVGTGGRDHESRRHPGDDDAQDRGD